MAIKGKGRTRTEQPVRAPRRGPVPVPVPFVEATGRSGRGGVPRRAARVLGRRLADERPPGAGRPPRAPQQELLRRRAGAAWETFVETQVGTIGTVTEGPPARGPAAGLRRTAGLAEKHAEGRRRDAPGCRCRRQGGVGGDRVLRALELRSPARGSTRARCCGSSRRGTSWSLRSRSRARRRSSGSPRRDLDVADRAAAIARAQTLLALADAAMVRFQTHQNEALTAAGIIRQPGLPPGA